MAAGGVLMSQKNLQQWMAWRDDYRCARPDVSCQGCDTFYPQGKHAPMMQFQGFNLVHCSECEKPKAEPVLLFPHVYKRVFRDVACRYIQRFGGSTFSVQTDVDDAEIYLRNALGFPIATVSMFDRFPKPVDASELSDIPF